MKIHLSGYNDEEKKNLLEIIKKFNLEVEERFTLNTNVLVCETVL